MRSQAETMSCAGVGPLAPGDDPHRPVTLDFVRQNKLPLWHKVNGRQ